MRGGEYRTLHAVSASRERLAENAGDLSSDCILQQVVLLVNVLGVQIYSSADSEVEEVEARGR